MGEPMKTDRPEFRAGTREADVLDWRVEVHQADLADTDSTGGIDLTGEIDLADPIDVWSDDEPNTGELDLADRHALRRVAGLSTELTDVTEVEYRQLRLERVVLVGVWTEGTIVDAENSLIELAALAETAGFILTAGALLLAHLRRLGTRAAVAVPLAGLLVPVAYHLFAVVLRVPLPRGWLGW